MTYEEANIHFKSGDYNTAFEGFRGLAEDQRLDVTTRVNSFTMMGNIIRGFADIDNDDDTGIKFYRKAFDLDNTDISVLLNIVYSFGREPWLHRDEVLFNTAFAIIKDLHWYNLEPDEKISVEKIRHEYFGSP